MLILQRFQKLQDLRTFARLQTQFFHTSTCSLALKSLMEIVSKLSGFWQSEEELRPSREVCFSLLHSTLPEGGRARGAVPLFKRRAREPCLGGRSWPWPRRSQARRSGLLPRRLRGRMRIGP